MKVLATELPGVLIIEPRVFEDDRGYFFETYQRARYADAGISAEFVQDNFSFSKRGALRGLHFRVRKPEAKLVTALEGEVFDVAVDLRRNSPTFKRWIGVLLDGKSKRQLFVPAGFGHGFLVVSETAKVSYKCTEVYDPKDEAGVALDDPELSIEWPLAPSDVLLSPKDAALPRLFEARLPFSEV